MKGRVKLATDSHRNTRTKKTQSDKIKIAQSSKGKSKELKARRWDGERLGSVRIQNAEN
jgi:hypothetical protein